MNNNEISWTIENMNGAFNGLESLNRLGLDSNRIKSIAKRAFQGLDHLKLLHLTDNAINSIQDNAFHPMQLQELRFNSTTLVCDCQLSWFPSWLKNNGFEGTVNARCAHPETLKGRSIFEIGADDFKCDDIPKPEILEEPLSQTALKGGNLTLECTAASSSDSRMTVLWRKDNKIIESHNGAIENFESANGADLVKFTSKLYIRNVEFQHAGTYQCIISNHLGTTYSEKADVAVHVFPAFTKIPKDVTVKAKTTARLECAADGNPPPEMAWQKDGGDDFPAARERRMHVVPADHVFLIMNVKREDQGVYSCTATNAAGVVIANASLTVLENPSFVKAMEQTKVTLEGETTVLECLAQGSPKPKVEWMRDGEPLKITQRHFFTAENQLLIIVQTQPQDAGKYTCVMSNTLGTEKDVSELVVTSPRGGELGLDDDSTTTGIIIIAVVCCVVGTSLVWVIIIYQTRKKTEDYSTTPTDETTLPGDVGNGPYREADCDGISNGMLGNHLTTSFGKYPVPEMNGGYHLGSGKGRGGVVIFPSDIEDDDQQQSAPLTLEEHQPAEMSDNSISALRRLANSDSDTVNSSSPSTQSTRSTRSTGLLQTFLPHPHPTNHKHFSPSSSQSQLNDDDDGVSDYGGVSDLPAVALVMPHTSCRGNRPGATTDPRIAYVIEERQISDGHHGSQPPGGGAVNYDGDPAAPCTEGGTFLHCTPCTCTHPHVDSTSSLPSHALLPPRLPKGHSEDCTRKSIRPSSFCLESHNRGVQPPPSCNHGNTDCSRYSSLAIDHNHRHRCHSNPDISLADQKEADGQLNSNMTIPNDNERNRTSSTLLGNGLSIPHPAHHKT